MSQSPLRLVPLSSLDVVAEDADVRLLDTLGRLDLLPGEAAADLTEAYKRLRAAYHRSALREQPTTVPDGELREERARVRALWAALMEEGAA